MKKGFTLIELLVGISIIAIVFSIGIANYREFSRRQALTGISKQLKADLRSIQQLALTGQKPEGVSCNTLNGYSFTRSGSSGYTLSAYCSDAQGVLLPAREIKTVNLGTDITISTTTPSFIFKVLGQGTDLLIQNTITLTHTSGNQINLVVGIGGDTL